MMAGILPDVPWPSDVEAYAARVDVMMRATDAAVLVCAGVTDEERKTWRDFYATWQKFFGEVMAPWILGGGSKNEEIKRYETQLADWQTTLRASCTVPGPAPRPRDADDQASLGAVKWVAAAAIAVALVVGVKSALR
jgi:hypothetical protein